MRKGKMSSIRRRSNKNFNLYDKFGNLKLENLNKRDRKKYLKKQEEELKQLEEEKRLPRTRRKIDGKWLTINK
tara:strand:- start:64 stop:282 length:219 start_codon:yes stop_codon:yes gene_type:complete